MLIRRPNQKYFLKKNCCYKEAAYSLDGEEKNQFAFGVCLYFLVAHIKVSVTPKILKRLFSYDRRDHFIIDEEFWLNLYGAC